MKQLTCEMCGSTDLLKNEGVFVCQTCGTKNSVEETKKMMIEGTVEVTGKFKFDKESEISNSISRARNILKEIEKESIFICGDEDTFKSIFYLDKKVPEKSNSLQYKFEQLIENVLIIQHDNMEVSQLSEEFRRLYTEVIKTFIRDSNQNFSHSYNNFYDVTHDDPTRTLKTELLHKDIEKHFRLQQKIIPILYDLCIDSNEINSLLNSMTEAINEATTRESQKATEAFKKVKQEGEKLRQDGDNFHKMVIAFIVIVVFLIYLMVSCSY